MNNKAMRKEKYLLRVFVLIWISVYSGQDRCCCAQEKQANQYLEFEKLVQNRQETKALEIGDDLFSSLIIKYPENINLQDLQKRVEVTCDLAKLIIQGLESRQKEILTNIANLDVLPGFPLLGKCEEEVTYLLPPAQRLYWTNLEPFLSDPNIKGMATAELKFLRQYYDLKIQSEIQKVTNITTQITIANPESSDLYCYNLVLPLLYVPENNPRWENVDYLFEMMNPMSLDVAADFCLIQLERPKTAMAMAKYNARSKDESFRLVDWSLAASDKCLENHRPDIAKKLLHAVINNVSDKNRIVKLRLKIAEGYAKCGDNMKAAKECKQIANDFPETSLYGKVMISYFAYLAKQSETERILLELEPALETPKCQRYFPQLLYLKWWALHKTNQRNLADQIGKQLTEKYRSHLCIAPVLLDQAINMLPNPRLLRLLVRDFPRIKSAKQAQTILDCMKLYCLEMENTAKESNSAMFVEKASEQQQPNRHVSKWQDATAMDAPEDLPDLPELISFNPFLLPDVCFYLGKDYPIRNLLGKVDAKQLVHKRYDLSTDGGIELALTDLCELIRLGTAGYYRNHWPQTKRLAFVSSALDEILARDPDNHSAIMLKSQILCEQGNLQEGIDLLKVTSEYIKLEKCPDLFTELVSTACQIMSSNRLVSEEKEIIKRLVYQSGLPPDSPLAQYMEGQPLEEFEISLMFRTIRHNPFDFSESLKHYPVVPSIDPATTNGWSYRTEILMSERDVRELVELVTTFKDEKAPKEMIMLASSLCHFFAGRSSAAISTCKFILEQSTRLSHTAILRAKTLLGVLYYERGEYLKARKAFEYIANSVEGNRNMAIRYLSMIESKQ